jgi:putative membrane protein
MNNIAAAMTAYVGISLGIFGALCSFLGVSEASIAIACFISAALVAHTFAESITSTYIGIPAGDVVSVLPAHRLAKAGLGADAVKASADGALVGIITSTAALFPICAVMSDPVHLYSMLKRVMVFIVIAFSAVLVVSEGFPSLRLRPRLGDALEKVVKGSAVFVVAGLLGTVVLKTSYFACKVPDFPWVVHGFVPRSSLLLPLFAGLFGISGLLLSLGSKAVTDICGELSGRSCHRPRLRDIATSLLGGAVVGWMPGLTSGSAVTLFSPAMRETKGMNDIDASIKFIWLYSAISSSGAVFAVGALFGIMRARSGSMDAISFFMDNGDELGPWSDNILQISAILLSMAVAALASYEFIVWSGSRFSGMRRFLCSKGLAIASLVFVCSLTIALTGIRGSILLMAATLLGLIPPLIGVRRILLMGSLLVPIIMTLLPSL